MVIWCYMIIWDNPSHWLSYFSRWLKLPTSDRLRLIERYLKKKLQLLTAWCSDAQKHCKGVSKKVAPPFMLYMGYNNPKDREDKIWNHQCCICALFWSMFEPTHFKGHSPTYTVSCGDDNACGCNRVTVNVSPGFLHPVSLLIEWIAPKIVTNCS